MKDTILLSLEFARSLTTSVAKSFVIRQWEAEYALIPDTIDLLKNELKLQFEYFNDATDDVPLIGMNDDAGGTGDDTDKEYELWKRHNVDLRTHPLAIDPVVSGLCQRGSCSRRRQEE